MVEKACIGQLVVPRGRVSLECPNCGQIVNIGINSYMGLGSCVCKCGAIMHKSGDSMSCNEVPHAVVEKTEGTRHIIEKTEAVKEDPEKLVQQAALMTEAERLIRQVQKEYCQGIWKPWSLPKVTNETEDQKDGATKQEAEKSDANHVLTPEEVLQAHKVQAQFSGCSIANDSSVGKHGIVDDPLKEILRGPYKEYFKTIGTHLRSVIQQSCVTHGAVESCTERIESLISKVIRQIADDHQKSRQDMLILQNMILELAPKKLQHGPLYEIQEWHETDHGQILFCRGCSQGMTLDISPVITAQHTIYMGNYEYEILEIPCEKCDTVNQILVRLENEMDDDDDDLEDSDEEMDTTLVELMRDQVDLVGGHFKEINCGVGRVQTSVYLLLAVLFGILILGTKFILTN